MSQAMQARALPHPQKPHPQKPLQRRPGCASAWRHALLALALVLAQGVGLLHRTAHLPFAAGAPSHAAPDGAGSERATAGGFGHAAVQVDECRLFDQLALADLLVDAAPALPVFAAPVGALAATGSALALAVSTGYRARAPPPIG